MSTRSALASSRCGVGVAQLVRAGLFLDAGFLEHPPQVGAGRLRRHRLLTGRAGEHELAPSPILQKFVL